MLYLLKRFRQLLDVHNATKQAQGGWIKYMRKYLFLVLISILLTGCSHDRNEATTASSGDTGQSLYEMWQPFAATPALPSAITPPQPSEEPIRSQNPVILAPASTDRIDYAVYSEGEFCIYDGKKYGFMNDDGNEITPYIYDYAYPFSEGLACVCLDGKYGFIEDKGSVVIPLAYDKAGPFSEGLAYFAAGDKYGFINMNGDIAFFLNCDSVSSFKEGLAYFSDGGKYGYIDETGKVAVKPIYDDAGYFQSGLAKVRVGLKLGVIDKNGRLIVPADYDNISFDGGFIITESSGKYGCFDKNGNVIFKPVYDFINMLPGRDSAIVYLGDQPEIVDFKGNIKVAPKYDRISYYSSEHDDGMIEVRLNDKVGFLNISDFSEVIPPVNDWASLFTNGCTVVSKDNKYGVIDTKGNMAVPFNYDYVELFDTGKLALNQGGKYVLADAGGKTINDNKYDSIEEIGNYYIVETDGKYGLLDENGLEVVAPFYDYISTGEYNNVYHSQNCCVPTVYDSEIKDCIIVTGQDQDTDLSDLLLQNEITPRIKLFNRYEKSGYIRIPSSDNKTMMVSVMDGMNDCYKEFKLYDIDGSGNLVLYFYAEGLIRQGPGILSYSGLYSVKDGLLNEIATGFQGGGSAGGDVVSFIKDAKTSKLLIGEGGRAGGIKGVTGREDIYDYQNGEAKKIVAYECIAQPAGNYDKSDLIKNAGLFYDENSNPYNKDTILNADYVTEYWLNNKQVTIEAYSWNADRYEALPDFLCWLH